jgi:hypothetical protein
MYGDIDYQAWGNPADEPTGKCEYCLAPTDDTYCCKQCKNADLE